MRFNINVGAVATLLATLVTLQSMGAGPAYASHRAGALPSTAVNVRSFGAQGNGIADDTTAIQNAANFAAGSRRSLFFPPGTYLHGGFITFNGVAVNGSGTASVLLAADNNSTAVALTGSNPSIQNMVISSAGLGLATAAPATSTILVQNANSFTVANDTIVQGQNRVGVYILSSSTGVVNACAFDGSGFSGDTGAVIVQSHNVSIENSLFQNEGS